MATLEAPVRPRTQSSHQGPFINEPFYDFRHEDNARKMRAAIERVRGQLGREYDLIIGGQRVKTTDKIKSLNPSKPSQIVGIHQKAGKEQVEPAMQAALKAFATWSRTSVEERASLLFRAADRLRDRKMDYMACWFSKSAKTGPKPMPISPKPSTSASSMLAKLCALPRLNRPSRCPASTIRSCISRSESAP